MAKTDPPAESPKPTRRRSLSGVPSAGTEELSGSAASFGQLPASDWVRLWMGIRARGMAPDLARQMQLSMGETALMSATFMSIVSVAVAMFVGFTVPDTTSTAGLLWGILIAVSNVSMLVGLWYLHRRRRHGTFSMAAFNWVLVPSRALGAVLWGVLPLIIGRAQPDMVTTAATISLVVALIGFFWAFGDWAASTVFAGTILVLLVVSFYSLGRPEWTNQLMFYPVCLLSILAVSAFATYGLTHVRYQILLSTEREQLIRLLVKDYERGGHEWLWDVNSSLDFTRVPPRMKMAADGDERFELGKNLKDALAAHPVVLRRIDEQQPFQVTVTTNGMGGQGEMRLWGRPKTSNGVVSGYRGVGSDKGAARRVRDAERASERLDAMVSVTSGIAHDFNNLLASVLTAVELARFDPAIAPSTKINLDKAVDACLRTRRLTSDLVVASGYDATYEPCPLEVGPAIQTVALDLESLYPQIDIEVDVPDQLWVSTDVSHFDRAIRNLIENACEAITEDTTRDLRPEGDGGDGPGWVRVRAWSFDESRCPTIAVGIEDNGPGVPTEARSRLFEPFVTTRRASGGTGLGLAIARGFANQAGGRLLLEPTVSGATFRLELPRHSSGVDGSVGTTPQAASSSMSKVSGRILVVEDDENVADNLAQVLSSIGALVDSAASVSDALARFSDATEYDCVISDLVLPDGEGYEVVRKFRSRHPDMKAVYMSGFTLNLPATVDPELRCPFLPKPFSIPELIDVLGAVGVPILEGSPSIT